MMTKEEIAQEWGGRDWKTKELDYDGQQILAELEGAEILFAEYDQGGYDGDSTVIYRKDGKLYETHGSHCSCYGLEDQWSPEEATVDAILMRTHDYGTQADARLAIKALHEAGVL